MYTVIIYIVGRSISVENIGLRSKNKLQRVIIFE